MKTDTIFTVIPIVIGVLTYITDKIITRRDRTISILNELIDCYQTEIPKDREDKDYFIKCKSFLGKVERMCIGIDAHVYCKRTVRRYGSKFLIYLYDRFENYIIEQSRKQYQDSSKYNYLEKTVKSFRKTNKWRDRHVKIRH